MTYKLPGYDEVMWDFGQLVESAEEVIKNRTKGGKDGAGQGR